MQSNRNRLFKTRHEQQGWPSKIGRNSKFDLNALSHPQMTRADCYVFIGQPMPSQCPLVSHTPPLQFSSENTQLQHSPSKHIYLYSILKVVIGSLDLCLTIFKGPIYILTGSFERPMISVQRRDSNRGEGSGICSLSAVYATHFTIGPSTRAKAFQILQDCFRFYFYSLYFVCSGHCDVLPRLLLQNDDIHTIGYGEYWLQRTHSCVSL